MLQASWGERDRDYMCLYNIRGSPCTGNLAFCVTLLWKIDNNNNNNNIVCN